MIASHVLLSIGAAVWSLLSITTLSCLEKPVSKPVQIIALQFPLRFEFLRGPRDLRVDILDG